MRATSGPVSRLALAVLAWNLWSARRHYARAWMRAERAADHGERTAHDAAPQASVRRARHPSGRRGLGDARGHGLARQHHVLLRPERRLPTARRRRDKRFRIGGMVVKGSVARNPGDLEVRFVLTDFAHEVPVEYTGVLPDLFREGQGIIAHGTHGRRRRLRRRRGAREARREVHAARSGGVAEEQGRQPKPAPRAPPASRSRHGTGTRNFRADPGLRAQPGAGVFRHCVGAWRGKPVWMAVARPAVTGQFVFVAMAFGCLVYSFVEQRFLGAVRRATTPTPSCRCSIAWRPLWGAHEGSLLLWILILSIWSVAVARFSRQLPATFASRVLGVMGLVSGGFMLFTLWTSNPFLRLIPAAADGADLNPVLQDFALAIHPPMLYTGYVGFSVAFAFACAAMLEGRLDQAWAQWTRPWTHVRLDVPDHRHRARQLVGLLRTRLGRLVVLGSGRERLVHAVAGRHRAGALARASPRSAASSRAGRCCSRYSPSR